jgi:hypothetical protein
MKFCVICKKGFRNTFDLNRHLERKFKCMDKSILMFDEEYVLKKKKEAEDLAELKALRVTIALAKLKNEILGKSAEAIELKRIEKNKKKEKEAEELAELVELKRIEKKKKKEKEIEESAEAIELKQIEKKKKKEKEAEESAETIELKRIEKKKKKEKEIEEAAELVELKRAEKKKKMEELEKKEKEVAEIKNNLKQIKEKEIEEATELKRAEKIKKKEIKKKEIKELVKIKKERFDEKKKKFEEAEELAKIKKNEKLKKIEIKAEELAELKRAEKNEKMKEVAEIKQIKQTEQFFEKNLKRLIPEPTEAPLDFGQTNDSINTETVIDLFRTVVKEYKNQTVYRMAAAVVTDYDTLLSGISENKNLRIKDYKCMFAEIWKLGAWNKTPVAVALSALFKNRAAMLTARKNDINSNPKVLRSPTVQALFIELTLFAQHGLAHKYSPTELRDTRTAFKVAKLK